MPKEPLDEFLSTCVEILCIRLAHHLQDPVPSNPTAQLETAALAYLFLAFSHNDYISAALCGLRVPLHALVRNGHLERATEARVPALELLQMAYEVSVSLYEQAHAYLGLALAKLAVGDVSAAPARTIQTFWGDLALTDGYARARTILHSLAFGSVGLPIHPRISEADAKALQRLRDGGEEEEWAMDVIVTPLSREPSLYYEEGDAGGADAGKDGETARRTLRKFQYEYKTRSLTAVESHAKSVTIPVRKVGVDKSEEMLPAARLLNTLPPAMSTDVSLLPCILLKIPVHTRMCQRPGCEEDIGKKTIVVSCDCHFVRYCSEGCKTADKARHRTVFPHDD